MTDAQLTQAGARIRINGEDEPLVAGTLAALLEEKAVDAPSAGSRSRSTAPCAARGLPQTPLKPGDNVEIVRARQGG